MSYALRASHVWPHVWLVGVWMKSRYKGAEGICSRVEFTNHRYRASRPCDLRLSSASPSPRGKAPSRGTGNYRDYHRSHGIQLPYIGFYSTISGHKVRSEFAAQLRAGDWNNTEIEGKFDSDDSEKVRSESRHAISQPRRHTSELCLVTEVVLTSNACPPLRPENPWQL